MSMPMELEEMSQLTADLDIAAYDEESAMAVSFEQVLEAVRGEALTNEIVREMFGLSADGTEETMSAIDGDDDNDDVGKDSDVSEWSDDEGEVPVPFEIDEPGPTPLRTRASKEQEPRPASCPANTRVGQAEIDSEGPQRKKSRKRKRNPTQEFWRKWYRINTRSWENAKRNIHVVKGLDFKSHLSADQKRIVRPLPNFDKMPKTKWKGQQPRMAVDEKGVPAVIVFPRWLRGNARKIFYKLLIDFGREVEVNIKKAADKNARDTVRSYTRRHVKSEVHGVFQLVTVWRAVGRHSGPAGPSRDILNKIKTFNATMRLLKRLRVMSKRLDHLFQLVDPPQYAVFTAAKQRLGEKFPAYAALSAIDPTFFHGRSLIYNRETPLHTDTKDMKMAWTPVATVGRYKSGVMRVLDLEIEYRPGTLVFLRGGILPHAVTHKDGQRVAVAHFMHRDVLEDVAIGPLPLSAVWVSSTQSVE